MMNQIKQNDDKFARESFTMRGMAKWQLWGITIVTACVVVAVLVYALG